MASASIPKISSSINRGMIIYGYGGGFYCRLNDVILANARIQFYFLDTGLRRYDDVSSLRAHLLMGEAISKAYYDIYEIAASD